MKKHLPLLIGMSIIAGLFILGVWGRMESSKAEFGIFAAKFPTYLTDHFPENSEISGVKEFNYSPSYLRAVVKYKDKYVSNFKAKHGENLTEIGYHSDSVFMLDRDVFSEKTNIISEFELKEELKYALPNFRIHTREDSAFYKWNHYIVESKCNLDSLSQVELLFVNDSVLMQLEHGYSKGMSVNQEAKLIVYWLELW